MKNIKMIINILKTKVIRFCEFLSSWFSYFPVLWKCYDFDFSSILTVEQHQIRRVLRCIEKYSCHKYKDRYIRNMKLTLKLSEIYLSNDEGLECKYIKNNNDVLAFLNRNEDNNWNFTKKVNTKNWKRFVKSNPLECEKHDTIEIMKAELYMRKVWHLYNLCKEYNEENWWD